MMTLQEVPQVGGWQCRKCQRRLIGWKRGYKNTNEWGHYHIRCAQALEKVGLALLVSDAARLRAEAERRSSESKEG